MKLIKEVVVMELGKKKRTYSLDKRLNRKERIQFFAAIAALPEVAECSVDAFGDEIGTGGDYLRSPDSDPRTWLRRLTENNLTAKRATLRVSGHTCRVSFDFKNDLIVSTDESDNCPYEIILEKALSIL